MQIDETTNNKELVKIFKNVHAKFHNSFNVKSTHLHYKKSFKRNCKK